MFDLSRLYGSAYSPRSIQWRLIVGICGIRIVRAARSLTRHSRMLGKRLTCLHMRAPTFLALVGAMAPHDLRPIRIVAEVSFLAAAATATARGIPREFVSRGTSSDGMQKVNRSTDSRERQRERQRERERGEGEGERESSQRRKKRERDAQLEEGEKGRRKRGKEGKRGEAKNDSADTRFIHRTRGRASRNCSCKRPRATTRASASAIARSRGRPCALRTFVEYGNCSARL